MEHSCFDLAVGLITNIIIQGGDILDLNTSDIKMDVYYSGKLQNVLALTFLIRLLYANLNLNSPIWYIACLRAEYCF